LAERLEAAQQEARQVLAMIAEAEANIASLEQARSDAEGPVARMLGMEIGDARSHRAGLHSRLAEINERADDAVREVFASLSADRAMVLGLLYPVVVGNLDGAPLPVRIVANRVHMVAERLRVQHLIASLEREYDELRDGIVPPAPGARYMPGADVYRMQAILEQLEGERERLELLGHLLVDRVPNPRYGIVAGAERTIERQFLMFDPSGDGRIAELHGVIDARTRDIGILVPGTGADLGGFQALANRGQRFAEFRFTGTLATITWLGYDAPDSIVPDASFNRYADAGGPALRDFVAGLDLDHLDVTAVGHSYGGAVVGAAEREGMIVDNVVHVESAGASVDDVSDYPHSSRRYSMTAPGDPIDAVQGTLAAEPHQSGDLNMGHGLDPDTMPGVVRLETGRVDASDPNSDLHQGSAAHSEVMDFARSHAWQNIYNVMVGGEVTLYTQPDMTVVPDMAGGGHLVFTYPMEDPEYEPPRLDVP